MNTILISLIICSVYSFIIYKVLSSKINKKIDNKTFLKEVHEEINSLITQINETSDRNVLLIENRLERLNNLISISDRSIVNLKNYNNNIKKYESLKVEEEVIQEKVPIKIEEVITQEIKSSDINTDVTLTRRERIILLHRQGISPTIIASQTKATIGEVELIISLSRG